MESKEKNQLFSIPMGKYLKCCFPYFPKLKENKRSSFYYENQIAISVLADVDRIILLSDFAKDNFLKVYPQFGSKISVVPNGIKNQNEQVSVNQNIFTISTVGTVCERKGHDVLIEALTLMTQAQRKHIKVNIIGDGSLVEGLKNKCIKKKY